MGFSILSKITKSFFGASPLTAHQIRLLIQGGQYEAAFAAIGKIPSGDEDREPLVECLKGEASFHARRDVEAQEAFQRALRARPDYPEAHYGLSLLMCGGADVYLATKHAQFAVNMQPTNARFQAQLGYCHLLLGNVYFAESALKKAVRIDPENKYAWNNLGIASTRKGANANAVRCFKKALLLDHGFENANENLNHIVNVKGVLIEGDHEVDERSANTLEGLHLESPDDFELLLKLLLAYEAEGDLQSGIDAMDAWLAKYPDEPRACKALGLAWQRTGEPVKAERFLEVAFRANEHDLDVLKALSLSLGKQHRFQAAKIHLLSALNIQPDDAELWAYHAANLTNLCEYEEALAICEKWGSKDVPLPCHAPVLAYLGRFEEAGELFEKYIAAQPNEPSVRFFRASLRLLMGDFEKGWPDYRYRTIADVNEIRVLPFPEWNGESLEGKEIVILAEQGLGDQVMFSSCLKDLLALRPSRVVLEVINRVAETIERSFPEVTVVQTKQDNDLKWLQLYPNLHYFVHFGDLPRFFRKKISDFPRHNGYLQADSGKSQKWCDAIQEWERKRSSYAAGGRPRIGLSWRGGGATTRAVVRTLDVTNLLDICQGVDATWVCLQYGDVKEELEKAKQVGFEMAYWEESIADLDDFAAMISQLDLVITVCNTTVHYAGALGQPVWILAPFVPEWRYGLHWDSLPWYPSSKVYRQQKLNDWPCLLARVREDLLCWDKANK